MRKVKYVIKTLFVALSLCVAQSSIAETKEMGSICPNGETIFYGKMTRTGSEEKICKQNNEYFFSTKNGNHKDVVTVKLATVEKVKSKGTMGYSEGYDALFTTGDILKLRVTFVNDDPLPIAGFFIFNDNVVELEPFSIVSN